MPAAVVKPQEEADMENGVKVMHTVNVMGSTDADIRHAAERAAADLKDHGWAVIEGVLLSDECEDYVEGVWGWLEGLGTGINRNDPGTWGDDRWPPTFRGICNVLGIAHTQFVWTIRKHPRILQVFAALWGTNELLSSFDSINMLRPGQHESSADSWLHTDQAPLRRGAVCVQGLVNMVDVSPKTGTLLVKHGSHGEHARFFETASVLSEEQKAATADFYQFQDAERGWWRRFQSYALQAKRGSLFLWDSRTAHQNLLPGHTDTWRHVVYCCYQPRWMATEADLALKQQAYTQYRATTHWPAANVTVFPELGTEYYTPVGSTGEQTPGTRYRTQRSRDAVEDGLLRRLAGMEPYPADAVVQEAPLLDLQPVLEHLQLHKAQQ